MSQQVLCVDDDPNILASIKRTLGRRFKIAIAEGGPAGLEHIRDHGPFAVVISDMRMPGMDGVAFICEARKIAPHTTYMMLTGNSDQQTAIDAVNKGHIFRFMNKPCPGELLTASIEAAIRQYRLVTAERELLQKTLTGSIKALMEVLELVNPKAFSLGNRIKPIVHAMAAALKLDHAWQYDVAAMLSQIGCIVLPPDVIDKVFDDEKLSKSEQAMYDSHPKNGRKLIEHIPRLEKCSQFIEHQLEKFSVLALSKDEIGEDVIRGAQMLQIAAQYDHLMAQGLGQTVSVATMKEDRGQYDDELLDLLDGLSIPGICEKAVGLVEKDVNVMSMKVGMIADENIFTKNKALIVPKGQKLTPPMLDRLRNFAVGAGIKEPVRMLVLEVIEEAPAEDGDAQAA